MNFEIDFATGLALIFPAIVMGVVFVYLAYVIYKKYFSDKKEDR